jgi:Holliday junction resolvase
MVLPRIEERTLYEPIISYLKESGFQAIGNTMVFDKEPDVLFKYESLSFVIEVKIGKSDQIGVKAVAQAYDYSRKLETQNIIIVIFPGQVRNEPISDYNIVSKIALRSKVTVISLTEYWTESLVITLETFFTQLKENIKQSRTKIDFATTVKLIERYVSDLNSVVYQIRTDELVSEVVNKLELFTSIGEIKDKETAKKQVVNLASFLLFNQLLFYHIYKKRTNSNTLPEFGENKEITEIKDIQSYFNKITEIDYQSIYKVNLLSHIPNQDTVIEIINDIIKAIKLLRAEYITHDLAGRFFHDLIPFEVRKVLAAFYTHPNAADLLAFLAINSWDQTVIDPACGSGTLLVASYKRKLLLYESSHGLKSLDLAHKQFVENDLTGIDIMPFAAHISAINLTMQNIEERTNTIRIATQDSLELASLLKSKEFQTNGIVFSPYTTQIQRTLDEIEFAKTKRIKGTVSGKGGGSSFTLKPVDVVIMNPPFSDREKMPEEMRKKINNNPLSRICGNQVNLWGYFLSLADLLLKPRGIIAAVVPVSISRSLSTEKIRQFLIDRYHMRIILKPIYNIAFSEKASFRDVLLIAEKRNKREKIDSNISFVFLKKNKDLLSYNDIVSIADTVNSNASKEGLHLDTLLDMYVVNDGEVTEKNLNQYLWALNVSDIEPAKKFFEILTSKKPSKIKPFDINKVSDGFHTSPKGISEVVFITDPTTENRTQRAFLIYDGKEENKIRFRVSATNEFLFVNKGDTIKTLRTITGVKSIDIANLADRIIVNEYEGYKRVLILSSYKEKSKFSWDYVRRKTFRKYSHVTIFRRFNPYSPNTHILSVYSEEPFVPPDSLKIFNCDKKEAILVSLFMNSSIAMLSLLQNHQETTGQFIDVKEEDLSNFYLLDPNSLNEGELLALYQLFDEVRNAELPSILEQYENKDEIRVRIDRAILKVVGFTSEEIDYWLPKIYTIILEELKTMRSLSTNSSFQEVT